jgi:hypothetical protein
MTDVTAVELVIAVWPLSERSQASTFFALPALQLRELNEVAAGPSEAGGLHFRSNNVAGCSLAGIVEEELIAVGIIDH